MASTSDQFRSRESAARAQLITVTHGGHGIHIDEADKFNRELLKFVS